MESEQLHYEYRLYGYKVISGLPIPGLDPDVTHLGDAPVLTLSVTSEGEKESKDWRITWGITGERAWLRLGDNATYTIYPEANRIDICARNLEVVGATLLNLPFTILFTMKGWVLLHAAAIVREGRIVAFAGNKGMGKSTIVAALSHWYPLFSDDTVLVVPDAEGRLRCFSGLRAIKLRSDSYKAVYGANVGKVKQQLGNLQDKAIVDAWRVADRWMDGSELAAVIHVTRDIGAREVTIAPAGEVRKVLMHACITGTGTLGYRFDRLVENNTTYRVLRERVPLYRVSMPSGLDRLADVAGRLRVLLDECLTASRVQ